MQILTIKHRKREREKELLYETNELLKYLTSMCEKKRMRNFKHLFYCNCKSYNFI
jgi:hypothetical protein